MNNTFQRNTISQERLNALAIISVHKELISNISDFNEQVINLYEQKNVWVFWPALHYLIADLLDLTPTHHH